MELSRALTFLVTRFVLYSFKRLRDVALGSIPEGGGISFSVCVVANSGLESR
jgi:hypothetical protein